jgi:hypothetical protein
MRCSGCSRCGPSATTTSPSRPPVACITSPSPKARARGAPHPHGVRDHRRWPCRAACLARRTRAEATRDRGRGRAAPDVADPTSKEGSSPHCSRPPSTPPPRTRAAAPSLPGTSDGGPFPDRRHMGTLVGLYAAELLRLVEDWARFSAAEVAAPGSAPTAWVSRPAPSSSSALSSSRHRTGPAAAPREVTPVIEWPLRGAPRGRGRRAPG